MSDEQDPKDSNLEPENYYYGTPRIYPLAPDGAEVPGPPDPRILLFSQRNVERPVWHGAVYEFEDVIQSVDTVRMLAPHREPGSLPTRLGRRLTANARRHLGLPRRPDSAMIKVDGEYDLFFAVFHFAPQISYLTQVKDWRPKCRKAVCFLIEQWLPSIEKYDPYFEMLAQFDHVFVFSRWSMPHIRAVSGRPVDYLAAGNDAAASCPYPGAPPRTIDIYSIGRRLPAIHEALVPLMRQERLSYVFDSVTVGAVPAVDYSEHRHLMRHLLKRSRYFIVHRQNDSPHFRTKTGGEESLGIRYFEGIAGGSVLLGSAPDCDDYRRNFDWPDATLALSPDPAEVEQTLAELDAQPERLARIRHHNIVNALRRHDWVYRWQTVLDTVGLAPTNAMVSRTVALEELARGVSEHSSRELTRT